jgi:cytidylate kinase
MKSFVELMSAARQQWRTRSLELRIAQASAGPSPPAYSIAISRQRGAGGGAVARELGGRLGWLVYDRELVDRISEETGLRAELLESLDEKRSRRLVESIEAFFRGVRTMDVAAYAKRVAETMLALSLHGNCVIVGRGAAVILPAATTLRVRLMAPMEYRVRRMCDRLGMSDSTARHHIETTDRDRSKFVQQHFQRDVADLNLYDVVVNTAGFSTEQAAEIVVSALRQLQARPMVDAEPSTA